MSGGVPPTVRVVRRWAVLYTRGLPHDVAQRRCLELESDMWEHLHDPGEPNAARDVFGRFLRGIPADVWWRYRTLLESRGARQRSQNVATSIRSSWWVITTVILGLVPLGITTAILVVGDRGEGMFRVVSVTIAVITAALLIGGLLRQRSDLINGSQLIVAGSVLTLIGGGDFIPVGIIVLVSGFWTGNLRLSEPSDVPDLNPVRSQQIAMTRYWYVWLGAGATLFAIGWLPLLFDDPSDLSSGGWLMWVVSWLAAMIAGAIGLILAALRVKVRHHTRLV